MGKRTIFLFWAMLLFVMGNTRIGCIVTVDGQEMRGLYSPLGTAQAERTARLALEEIAVGQATVPTMKRRYRLSVNVPQGRLEALSHSIIMASKDAALLHLVHAGDERLGYVECAAVLKERLHCYAYTNMPENASVCFLSRPLLTEAVYCREQQRWGYEEMLNAVLDAAPIIYIVE